MSRMRQRLLVLPRVRSNSLSTLTAQPATSTSRPVPRLPSEAAPKQSQHSQLALTQPPPGLQPPLFPCTPPLNPNTPVPSHPQLSLSPAPSDSPRAHKRQRLQYQLDVGAYGIPKHRRALHTTNTYPHTALSVQVGEDAYFIRDNAMGIADGVGGWSRSVPPSPAHPTPSALFSRRLMHFCSAELDSLDTTPQQPSTTRPPTTTTFSFSHHLKPRSAPTTQPPITPADLLEDTLEDLQDGINILHILERAYDNTVKSHLSPSSSTPTPLTTGSSTALLAVLDHPSSLPQIPEGPQKNYAAGSLYTPAQSPPEPTPESTPDAVIRIAHLGDCMGMLIRENSIAWRSDEMWWGYNHPLQLGPPPTPSSSSQTTHPLPVKPHTFTLPVRADDILILASDGLSDNLWDEDVLDEVLKFRQNSCWGFSAPPCPSPSNPTQDPDPATSTKEHADILRRKAFAGMLSEALCSRAKRVSETRPPSSSNRRKQPSSPPRFSVIPEDQAVPPTPVSLVTSEPSSEDEDEVPFARRAKLAGKVFRGGKHDDISVIVAIISPSPSPAPISTTTTASSSSPQPTPSSSSSSTPHTNSRL